MRKCACCGNPLPDEDSLFEICSICNWERDDVMEEKPSEFGGTNGLSLEEAREYWNKYHKPIP